AASTTTARLLCRTPSYPAHGSGTRIRTSVSTFRAWRPAAERPRNTGAPLCPRVSRGRRRAASHAPCSAPGRVAPLRPRPMRGRRRSRRLPPWPATVVVCLARPRPNDVFHATRLPFDPGSPIAGCAHPSRSASSVEGFWSPRLACSRKNDKLKHTLLLKRHFCRQHRATFSLRRGLDSVQILLKLGITLGLIVYGAFLEQKRTTRRVALVWLAMRLAD